MNKNKFNESGLSDAEVNSSREKFGMNRLIYKKKSGLLLAIGKLLSEPMVLLLLVASAVYFISGKNGDGIFLAAAIVFEVGISLYQDSRSKNALEKLKELTQANCKVIRNWKIVEIKSEEVVVGDFLIVEEGTSVVADGVIVQSNDFSVNESVLTGESMAVSKDKDSTDNLIFSGTSVATGMAVAVIKSIGNETKIGKIGKSLESIEEEKTPLEMQINNFVKKMVIGGAVVFLIVWLVNYSQSKSVLDSLLKALTLAMSILPEEIPVAFTSFMALGAWRLMKLGIVVKQMKTVETLGSATVICTDKTGTITENRMTLVELFSMQFFEIKKEVDQLNESELELVTVAMWASEPIPFDPMEVALHQAYSEKIGGEAREEYKLVFEYPLAGKPPMMTHVFERVAGDRIIAAKGAPEAIMSVCQLSADEKQGIDKAIHAMGEKGYRILGVAQANFEGGDFPKLQTELKFVFKGLVAFYDPPKANISEVLQGFYKAGIKVKMITGDNAATSRAIAEQIGFVGFDNSISGDELLALSDEELKSKVGEISIFTRMFPEAKLKIINALKEQGEIVAMTGDGVNDGPALKAAHIGIAMGKKGTEIAKQAASLILLEDDFSKMLDAVAMGRRIYTNLKKAIRYIISIHIPIILTVFLPLALGWVYPNIFSPIHIIFLELIMGPTCSIIYENEPMEADTMIQKPRPFSNTFFNWKELFFSFIQGLAITAGALGVYQYAVINQFSIDAVRTMVFTVMITANIFLTLINRSFVFSIFTTLRYKNNLVYLIIGITILISSLLLLVPVLSRFFEFQILTAAQLALSIAVGFGSVIWIEVVKAVRRGNS